MGELAKSLSIIYHQFLANQGGLGELELANVMPIHRKGCMEDPGNCILTDPSACQAYGTDHLECIHMAHTGQIRDQAQPSQRQERQVLPDQLDLLL